MNIRFEPNSPGPGHSASPEETTAIRARPLRPSRSNHANDLTFQAAPMSIGGFDSHFLRR